MGFLALTTIFINQIPLYIRNILNKKINRETLFLSTAIASTTLALLASMLFIDALESSKVAFSYWLILGLIIGKVNLEEKNESK